MECLVDCFIHIFRGTCTRWHSVVPRTCPSHEARLLARVTANTVTNCERKMTSLDEITPGFKPDDCERGRPGAGRTGISQPAAGCSEL
jgi:hypothetical protein